MMIKLSNQDFLAEVAEAAPAGSSLWTCYFAGDPQDKDPTKAGRWAGYHRPRDGGSMPGNLDAKPACDLNTYYSTAALKMDGSGAVKRQKTYFSRLLVLVIDDANMEQMRGDPSYVLRTSPQKVQAGVLLDEQDPDCANADLCAALLNEMADRGMLGDKSGNNICRYVRLPVGTNGKAEYSGARVQMEQWLPSIRYTLADAASVIGIDLDEIRERLASVQATSELQRISQHSASVQLGAEAGQAEKLARATAALMAGDGRHEAVNTMASSLLASGLAAGSAVNLIRSMLEASPAPKDAKLIGHINDVPRSVQKAEEKFKAEARSARVEALAAPAGEQPKAADKPIAAPKPMFAKASELVATMTAPKWIIKGMLEADTTGMIYGGPGDGKSFLAFDLACCVATGTPWHGHKVAQGPVLYIAGEGQGGIKRRLAAWEKANSVSLADAPLIVTIRACNLFNQDSALELAEQAKEALGGLKPALVVIDTVARSMGEGNESDTSDASRYVASVDAALREPFGAHVMMVHHSGKDASKGARGSMVFKASVEQQFELQKEGKSKRKLVCHKMKDGLEPAPFHFELHTVELGQLEDQFGDIEQVTSAVVRPLDAASVPVTTERGAKGVELEDLDAVTPQALAMFIDANQGWPGTERLSAHFGCSKTIISRGLEKAVSLGLLVKAGRFYAVPRT